jgi:hypothetical protein
LVITQAQGASLGLFIFPLSKIGFIIRQVFKQTQSVGAFKNQPDSKAWKPLWEK